MIVDLATYELRVKQSIAVFQDMARFLGRDRRFKENEMVNKLIKEIIELYKENERHRKEVKVRKIQLIEKQRRGEL